MQFVKARTEPCVIQDVAVGTLLVDAAHTEELVRVAAVTLVESTPESRSWDGGNGSVLIETNRGGRLYLRDTRVWTVVFPVEPYYGNEGEYGDG